MAVQKVASLDEKTVQKVAKREVALPKRRTKKQHPPVQTNRTVPLDEVHPKVRRTALRLARRDKTRITTVSTTEVLVK